MNEIRKPFSEVITEEKMDNLYRRLAYDKDDNDTFFEGNDFINGLALVKSGVRDAYYFDDEVSYIVDTEGKFVDISLDKNIKYSNGEIVTLDESDRGSYFFKVERIWERKFENNKEVECCRIETSFFVIKVKRYSNRRNEAAVDLSYVINSKLEVIASFSDTNTWGNEFDGYKNVNIYTERDFYFIDKRRDFMVFSQRLVANSEDNGFYERHMYGLEPNEFEDLMQEDELFSFVYDNSIEEEEIDDELMQKVVAKYNGELDENDDEYDDIPYLEDIDFFFEDTKNEFYKDVFTKIYKTLYGIIDCNEKAAQQLLPFTDKMSKVSNLLWARLYTNKDIEFRLLNYGWDPGDIRYRGYVLQNKFFEYPSYVKGFTLKYLYKYYPKQLENLGNGYSVLIPNKLLDTLEDSELTRKIRLNQEVHLIFSDICSVAAPLKSSEKYGIVSSFQGKTIDEIVYCKGGTKYLVKLLELGKLKVEKSVLLDLRAKALNDIEEKCYNILLDVIEDIKWKQSKYDDMIQKELDEYNIREVNREFNDMMNDMDAWGNID